MRKRIWIPTQVSSPFVVELPTIGVEGLYHVELIDEDSGKIKKCLDFHNVITNNGLNSIGSGTTLNVALNILAVGTGSTTPAITDTALVAQIASTSFDGGFADFDSTQTIPVEFSFRKRTRVFLASEANGDLRELGFVSGNVLINRSLFKDSQGNPTTVLKTATDLLKVVYEYRIYAPLTDVTGTFHLGPAACGSLDYVIRPQNVNNALGWGALLSNMGSQSAGAALHESLVLSSRTSNNEPTPTADASTASLLPYTGSNFYQDTFFFWDYTVGNFTSSGHLVTWNPWKASNRNIWQMACSASIEKHDTNQLTLIFRQRWTRV